MSVTILNKLEKHLHQVKKNYDKSMVLLSHLKAKVEKKDVKPSKVLKLKKRK